MSESETDNASRRERRAKAKGAATGETKDRNRRVRAEAGSQRRKERQRELSSAAREGLDASERMDDALTRTADATGRFLKNHFSWLQWIVVLGCVGAMAFLVYDYRQGVDREKQGSELAAALAAVYGRLSTDEAATPADRSLVDTRREFSSDEERLKQAEEAWQHLAAKKSPEMVLMAKLGRASVLYDEKKYAEARKAYDDAFSDPTAGRFPELKARAQEGIGLCYEAEGLLDDALKSFLTLKDMGSDSSALATFHEGRVKFNQGKVDEAKALLEKLLDKLTSQRGSAQQPGYLEAATEDLLKTVDPARAAKPQGISPEQLEALKRQLEEMQKKGVGSAPPAPAPEAPAPQAPAPQAPAPQAPAPQAPAPQAPRPSGPSPQAPTPAPLENHSPPAAPSPDGSAPQ